jgi:fucose 4-O-acetylase-like acetyltransferase
MNGKRLDYLDMAKGIGIVLVVVGHSGFASDVLLTWLSSFHMPLFFIISGMLLEHKQEEKNTLSVILARKAQGLMIPYVVFSVIYILINVYWVPGVSLREALLETSSFYGFSVLWFLPALFLGEVIFIVLRKNTNHPLAAIMAGVICLAGICLNRLFGNVLSQQGGWFQWMGYAVHMLCRSGVAVGFLMIGYYTMYFACRIWEKKTIWNGVYFIMAVILFGVNAILGSLNGRVDMRSMVFGNTAVYLLVSYFGSMAVILLCRALPPIRLLSYLGRNSLSIMVTHLDCYIMYFSHIFAYYIMNHFGIASWHVFYFNIALALFVMEMVIVYCINHFFPFLIGRKRR